MRTASEFKLVHLVELYCRDFAIRLGYVKQDGPNEAAAMARFLDKQIAKGHFRTGGVVNNNPVILNLFGGVKLFWKQVYPILRGTPVKGTAFMQFFIETYTRAMLYNQFNSKINMDETIIRIAVLGDVAEIKLKDLDDYYHEFK